MRLQGSCRCGAVGFSVDSRTPYPFMRCYCTICRKTDGGGGYAVNIMAEAATLDVSGADALASYRVAMGELDESADDGLSSAARHFCRHCGTMLWLADDAYPQWLYPLASAIDTPLPTPPERVHIMLDFAVPWADVPEEGPRDRHFARYPEESIEDWHRRHKLYEE